MRKNLIGNSAVAALFLGALMTAPQVNAREVENTTPLYLNTNYSFEERATDLVSRLTLEEKQGLLGNNMAAVPRLGIKSYNVWSEALHGVLSGANASVGLQGPTSFPGSVALGSSWDPELMALEASVIADEARAIFQTGTKGLTFWSPVVEPIRDPRWGRTGESYGEDPFLAATMSSGFVRGLMGSDETYMKAVPCAKHYFANNSEFDRHVGSSNMDSRDMREFYLYPYKELIEKDALPSIMSSYNAVNHVPTSASVLYLDSIARRTYGMKGYVTGDCAAIEDIYTGHYYVETAEEATAAGLKAGVDSDCGSVYQRYALSALEKGLITEADMDRALVNMFVIRMRTGEFDPQSMVPYTMYPASVVNSERSQAIAMEVATRTPVLLKNTVPASAKGKALPVDLKSVSSIALVGPQADKVELGPYSGRPEQSSRTTPYQGITKYIADKGLDVKVTLAQGGSTKSKSNLLYVAYFETEKPDGTKKRYDATQYTSASTGITVGSGMGTEEQVRSIDDGSWTAYEGVDLVNVEKMTVGLNIPTEGGIVEAHVGSPEGNLIGTIEATKASGARVGGVYGASAPFEMKVNKLGVNDLQTLYLVYKAPEDDEIDPEVLKAAQESDVAIVFVGTDENTATEEADRLTLDLPGNQLKLIQAVAGVNKNTIVVMQTLGCVEVEEFKNLENVSAILWTGYNGQAQGAAIPKILFGDVTPGGKLNATWYKSVKDLPLITDYTLRAENGKPGRTLWYFTKPVSYEFGYGLSYTTFEYSNFSISKKAITPDDKITVSVDVKNTGEYDGDEVVQIYVRTPDSPASLQRPIKRLKGYQRVTIPVGQTKTVQIDIDCADLWFWDMDKDCMTYDSGNYIFEVGSSSQDIRGTLNAQMNGKFTPVLKTVVAECGVSVMKIGQTAQTTYSACLSNDAFVSTSKTSVKYTSSNPSVAEIDADGKLTAKGSGIATITVSVTFEGKTVSDTYSVKVNPVLELASLKVNGKSVLKAGQAQYSVISKASAKVPEVTATAKDAALKVSVDQAKTVPGTAVVRVYDPISYDMTQVLVNVGTKSQSDEFGGSALGSQWTVIRPDESKLKVNGGSLEITTAAGDITQTSNNAANMVLQSANTDWTIDTKLSTSAVPAAPAQNAGILVSQDDDNFVKFVYTTQGFGGGRGPQGGAPQAGAARTAAPQVGSLQLIVEEKGASKTIATVNPADSGIKDNTVWLRLVKKGDKYTAYASTDGKNYSEAGQAQVVLKDIMAGVIATDGVQRAMGGRGMAPMGAAAAPAAATTPMKAKFDYFRITNK